MAQPTRLNSALSAPPRFNPSRKLARRPEKILERRDAENAEESDSPDFPHTPSELTICKNSSVCQAKPDLLNSVLSVPSVVHVFTKTRPASRRNFRTQRRGERSERFVRHSHDLLNSALSAPPRFNPSRKLARRPEKILERRDAENAEESDSPDFPHTPSELTICKNSSVCQAKPDLLNSVLSVPSVVQVFTKTRPASRRNFKTQRRRERRGVGFARFPPHTIGADHLQKFFGLPGKARPTELCALCALCGSSLHENSPGIPTKF